ncbi:MAG: class I SAM-dependent methyltransferase [Clostridia bacterium]|nr:class I SAM-dependent methyltransferase [Clostridia bacterium]
MLEKMSDFFEARLNGYDEHMLNDIESATEFYTFTAKQLPTAENCRLLDLGCGTGLELEEYFKLCPSARVTGIDLSKGMLAELERKFTDKAITLVHGSYFDVPLGKDAFDAAVSVESLHHFTKEEKIPLYSRLRTALKSNGYFILTDYFAPSDDEEIMHRQNLNSLKAEQGIADNEFYHYDTPLTVEHEKEALLEAGFSSADVLNRWGATYTIKAVK